MNQDIREGLSNLRELSNASNGNMSTHPFCRRSSEIFNGSVRFGESPSNKRMAAMLKMRIGELARQSPRYFEYGSLEYSGNNWCNYEGPGDSEDDWYYGPPGDSEDDWCYGPPGDSKDDWYCERPGDWCNYEEPSSDQVECENGCSEKYDPRFSRTPDWEKYWQCTWTCRETHASPKKACYARCAGKYDPSFGTAPDWEKYSSCLQECR